MYYIQAKCGGVANKNPNAADDNEQTLDYRLPYEDCQGITKKFRNCFGQMKINTSNWKEKVKEYWWIYWQIKCFLNQPYLGT